ncbi:Dynein heavy chain 12, axonemal [Homalodisca vitripennis]|nr:Dynein heavy chain 12, axonemal [Homalodisca vitripennis]
MFRKVYVVIFQFLKGIAGCGAFGCLNDFHKVQLDVLSVVAQQLTSITAAIRDQSPNFTFDGDLASLDPRCYICVTLFPGFSVQSPVPENLKMLFRPVSMMCPDVLIVAEITLLASGFTDCRELALKLLTLQTLCSKQLSDQGRYACDFGCLKAILRVASRVKQAQQYTNEDSVLLQAITDILCPMLTEDNSPILNSILTDLFPNHQLSLSPSRDQLRSSAIQVNTQYVAVRVFGK